MRTGSGPGMGQTQGQGRGQGRGQRSGQDRDGHRYEDEDGGIECLEMLRPNSSLR